MTKVLHNMAYCLVGGLVWLLLACPSRAAVSTGHSDVLAQFVNDDTFAVLYADIGSAVHPENPSAIPLSVLPGASANTQPWLFGAMLVDGFVRRLHDAGGQSVFVVAGLADIHTDGGPIGIITTKPGQQPEKVEKLLKEIDCKSWGRCSANGG